MAIEHVVYQNGRVHGLNFLNNGRQTSVRVIEPGSYDLGLAEKRIEISVVTGNVMGPDGRGHGHLTSSPVVFHEGEQVKFSCVWPVVCFWS